MSRPGAARAIASALLTLFLALGFGGPPSPIGAASAGTRVVFLLEGINSSMSAADIARFRRGDHRNFNPIVAQLQQQGWGDAEFVHFSYTGGQVAQVEGQATWEPTPYSCADTFTRPIASGPDADVLTLHRAISAYLDFHPGAQVYLVGHSQGGLIAFAYLAELRSRGWALPNGGHLAGVVTLDSPLGGIPTSPSLGNALVLQVTQWCSDRVANPQSLLDMQAIWASGGDGAPHGGTESIVEGLWHAGYIANQRLAEEARDHNTRVLTVGNTLDFLYQPCDLIGTPLVPAFPDTQWLADGGATAGVYGRAFVDGTSRCRTDTIAANHHLVLTNAAVLEAIGTFLAGGEPATLRSIPPASPPPSPAPPPALTGDCVTFAETGQEVCGAFRHYWEQHGGLPRFGYPLSGLVTISGDAGAMYQAQYFERARLEYHPENAQPYDVLLGQFGRAIHPADPPVSPLAGQVYFSETGHNLGGGFLGYWEANGGLMQYGYPISEVFRERLEDGREYEVQYFERARFEYHPENAPPYDILLGQFGRRMLDELTNPTAPPAAVQAK